MKKNLVDYLLILDLIPKFASLFFECKLDIQLSYLQCAILLGIGFQKKSIQIISDELNIIVSQATAMLNKTIRKFHIYFDNIIKQYIQNKEVKPMYQNEDDNTVNNANQMVDPMIALTAELRKNWISKKEKRKVGISKRIE